MNWLESNVKVSPFPKAEDIAKGAYDNFSYRINVSDLYRPVIDKAIRSHTTMESFWFPQGEAFGLSLESLYGSLRVLWEAERAESNVLLHCHAGRNRSQMVYDSYYFMQTGKHPKNSKLLLNIDDGQFLGLFKMEEFLEGCKEVFMDGKESLRPVDSIKHEMHMRGSGFT